MAAADVGADGILNLPLRHRVLMHSQMIEFGGRVSLASCAGADAPGN